MESSGGPLKKTILNDWHRANGGKMVDFGGWDMPVQYASGIQQEHLATRKFGGLFDVSHMGRFRIKGAGRMAFLQHVLTNNALALKPWQAQYTIIPNANGGAVDDAYLYRFGEDDYLLVVNAGNLDKDWAHFQAEAKGKKDLVLEDWSSRMGMIAVQGPLAATVLTGMLESGKLPVPGHNNLSEGTLCGAKCLISRTGYTGEPVCFELFVPAEKAEAIWSAVLAKGGPMGMVPVGLGARDTLRLEASMPLYGHELGIDTEGKEIPIFGIVLASFAVSLAEEKGDFIGKAALKKQYDLVQKMKGGTFEISPALPRRTRAIALLDKGVVRQGDPVFIGSKKVGAISSGTAVPYWKMEGEGATLKPTDQSDRRSIALGYLDADVRFDQQVEIEVRGRRIKAVVARSHGKGDNGATYFRPVVIS